MNKKWLLGIILSLTLLTLLFVTLFTPNTRYNKLIISEEKWNKIINSRDENNNLILKNIKFNDYNLLIDEENSVVYYSVVNSSKKYNPLIEYGTDNKLKIAFNKKITDDVLEQDNNLKIMLYNDDSYKIYSLVITNYSILNINIEEKQNNKKRIDISLELFDNHVNSRQRLLKSIGKLNIIEENKEYSFSLIKESLGHNKRENNISIFGMQKHDEYTLSLAENTNEEKKYVRFFINNKYLGLYSLGYDERGMNIFERNKENNK